MAAGADKIITYDPPGAIGLVDRDAVVLLRFNEVSDTDQPVDSAGGLNDLGIVTGLAQPVVVSGIVGRGRQFNAGTTTGFVATDRVPGSTLLTRDMSVQMIVSFSMANQVSYGTPGQIAKRGKGTNWGASERMSWAINSSHVAVPAGDCALSWEWETVAGVLKSQTSVVFTPPPAGKFTLITLTRRWISPTSVILRYYCGDLLLGQVASVDGDIGGATTGTTGIGSVGQAGGAGYGRTFANGILDELMVVDRELCAEEIEATWLRLTRYQPLGTQLFLEMHDSGFPMSKDPSSDIQLDTRMIGQSLGFAAAAAENLRANFLPPRAYGTTLEQWEEAVRPTQQPTQDLDTRRARVLARMRQRRGVSIPGLGDALEGLIGAATIANLQFLAFSNTWTDTFATLSLLRWDVSPSGAIAASAGVATATFGTGISRPFTGIPNPPSPATQWVRAATPVSANGKEARVLAKVTMPTPQAGFENGIWVGDFVNGNFLLFGLRDNAGTFQAITEQFVSGVSLGVGVINTFGGNPAALWLQMYNTTTTNNWQCSWSTTSGTTGFTTTGVGGADDIQWAGIYVRTTGAVAGNATANWDDFTLRSPFGTATMNAYVLLDQALGFSPDTLGAQSVIAAIKHAYTHGTFITRPALLCDDAGSGCDLGPLGGY